MSGVQICISDNGSKDATKQGIDEAGKVLTINYSVDLSNIGLACNFLEVVQMADVEFVWMLRHNNLFLGLF